MAKKNEEIDIDEEIKRISRKTNVDILKSGRTFDNRIKNLEKEIEKAIEEMNKLGIKGKEVTPFLLSKIVKLTEGKSLEANIALIKNNAYLAGLIAKELL